MRSGRKRLPGPPATRRRPPISRRCIGRSTAGRYAAFAAIGHPRTAGWSCRPRSHIGSPADSRDRDWLRRSDTCWARTPAWRGFLWCRHTPRLSAGSRAVAPEIQIPDLRIAHVKVWIDGKGGLRRRRAGKKAIGQRQGAGGAVGDDQAFRKRAPAATCRWQRFGRSSYRSQYRNRHGSLGRRREAAATRLPPVAQNRAYRAGAASWGISSL